MKRQRTNAGVRRQTNQAPELPLEYEKRPNSKNRELIAHNEANFAVFKQPAGISKTRGRQYRELLPRELINEAHRNGLVYKSSRSTTKRSLMNHSQPQTTTAIKNYSNQVQNLPYNIHISKDTSKLDGNNSTKPVCRTKVSTPGSTLQNVAITSNSYNVAEGNPRNHEKRSLQQRSEKSSLIARELEARHGKVPALPKNQNNQCIPQRSQASVSVSRTGATRLNPIEHSSLVLEQAPSDVRVSSKAYISRSRIRHTSLLASNETDRVSAEPKAGLGMTKVTSQGQKSEAKYYSKNVQRVKKCLEGDNAERANNNATNQSLSHEVQELKHHSVLDNLNQLQTMSKGAGGIVGTEKTTKVTTEDSREKLSTPSPGIEVQENPSAKKIRHLSAQGKLSSSQKDDKKQLQSPGRKPVIVPSLAKKPPSRQSDTAQNLGKATAAPRSQTKNKDTKNDRQSEKRLKNSETCPDQLPPAIERKSQHTMSSAKVGVASAPQTKTLNSRKSVAKRSTDITCDRKLNHSSSVNQTNFNDQPLVKQQHTTRQMQQELNNKRHEMQQKAAIIQLRHFRQLIDDRRRKNPDKQPLEMREFQIALQVGQGAFAIVRRAVHKESKHVIAIKTYEKKNLCEKEAQMAVHREINTLSDLWHPNIMKLHEVIDQRTHVHLVMEMCSGSSIYHHIKKQPDQRLAEEQCKHIFKQLVRGVAYMHSKGYAHRDLKLDNILMDFASKNIKIIDFGFSQRVRAEEKLSIYCGTPHYMDPDIVRKQPYNPFAADVWACGVILYIIYVGKMPFFGEFEADLFRKIQGGKFTQVPSDLGDEKIRGLFRKIFDVSACTRITAQQLTEHPWIRDTELSPEAEQELTLEQTQQQIMPPTTPQENGTV